MLAHRLGALVLFACLGICRASYADPFGFGRLEGFLQPTGSDAKGVQDAKKQALQALRAVQGNEAKEFKNGIDSVGAWWRAEDLLRGVHETPTVLPIRGKGVMLLWNDAKLAATINQDRKGVSFSTLYRLEKPLSGLSLWLARNGTPPKRSIQSVVQASFSQPRAGFGDLRGRHVEYEGKLFRRRVLEKRGTAMGPVPRHTPIGEAALKAQ